MLYGLSARKITRFGAGKSFDRQIWVVKVEHVLMPDITKVEGTPALPGNRSKPNSEFRSIRFRVQSGHRQVSRYEFFVVEYPGQAVPSQSQDE
jgi:hypothetical protein